MKRLSAIMSVLFLCCFGLSGGEKQKLHFGLEWGLSYNIKSYYHFNYLDATVGYRVDEKGWEQIGDSNAFIAAFMSLDLGRYMDLSLRAGYFGVSDARRVFPLMLQGNCYLRGNDCDGLFFSAGAGLVLGDFVNAQYTYLLRHGAGYRLALGSDDYLDFTLSIRCAYDRPRVWDRAEKEYVTGRNTLRNNIWYYALCFGFALSF